MILVDTSIWIDHLRRPNAVLLRLLGTREVAMHPFILGELTLGRFADRAVVLEQFDGLPTALTVDAAEVRQLIENKGLFASGIGYVDAHLVASARLMPGSRIWTRDTRLAAVAARLGVGETLH